MPPVSVLSVVCSVVLADSLGAGDQLIDAGLGDAKLIGDLLHLVTHQFPHFKRPCDAGVLGVHQGADGLVL